MKSFFRFLLRNPLYTFINIVGLAVSLMFVILFGDYTWRQCTVDSQHDNADRIVVLGNQSNLYTWHGPTQDLGKILPEVENTCCVLAHSGNVMVEGKKIDRGSNADGQNAANILLVDSSFFNIFDYDIVDGDHRSPLRVSDNCVITESLAHRLFPDGKAIGKGIEIVGDRDICIANDNPYDSTLVYTVSAVMKDFDKTIFPNSIEVVVHMNRQPQICGFTASPSAYAYTGNGYTRSFLLLRPGADLSSKRDMIKKYMNTNIPALGFSPWKETTLTPLRELMFSPLNDGCGLQKGDRGRMGVLLAVVVAIFLFAVTNYINLTMANMGFRFKEMATRMLLGSEKIQISMQLIAESAFIVSISFGLGLLLAFAFQDKVSMLFKGHIMLQHDINVLSITICVVFIVALSILSGIFPILQMAKYKPVDVIKGSFRYHSKMFLGRLFIMLQSMVMVMMLTATLVIYLQVRHLVNAPLGFNYENVFMVAANNAQAMREELDKMPFVQRVGCFEGTSLTGNNTNMITIHRPDNDATQDVSFYTLNMDSVALGIYGLKLSVDYGPSEGSYYLNERGARLLGLRDNDRVLTLNDGKHQLSGIFKDFHFCNILMEAQPFIIRILDPADMKNMFFLVKTDGSLQAEQRLKEAVARVDKTKEDLEWKVDNFKEDINAAFEDNKNTLLIVGLFGVVALFISTLGYIGTSVFFIRQHKKEVGIRKIMGCSTELVLCNLLRRFLSPLLLSYIIATPLAWYVLSEWLRNFPYRISLTPWMMLLPVAVSFALALSSVFLQTLRAACTNPVKTIKTE